MSLQFEDLDAYRAAMDFVRGTNPILARLARTQPSLVDQLYRAATSIALNLAEGAGEFSGPDKARFFRMSRRSATECAAILDMLEARRLLDPAQHAQLKELLQRLVAMLTGLARQWERNPAAARAGGTKAPPPVPAALPGPPAPPQPPEPCGPPGPPAPPVG
jgi:four helix bundle protein